MFDIYKEIWQRRKMVNALALQEMKKEYAGTLFGILWGLINPLMRITVYWFVFSIGARASQSVNGASFVTWLAVGMVAWFLINDGFQMSQKSFRSRRNIIKNTPFPIVVLPTVKILFSFYNHLILLGVMLVVMFIVNDGANLHWIQLLYYDFAAMMLLIGLGSVTAPLVAISKDFGRFLDTTMVFLFWMTPILWSIDNLEEMNLGWVKDIVKLNPFHYIVQGYRDSIFFHTSFWEYPIYSLYFWGLVLGLFILGNYLYKRMKPIFLDIL